MLAPALIPSSEALYSDSHKSVMHYFQAKKTAAKTRFSDFVILPKTPELISHSSSSTKPLPPTLDFDSAELVEFSQSTINMLKNNRHIKVYPYPIVPIKIEELDKNSLQYQTLKLFSLVNCTNSILLEKQYPLTFNVVGHGAPKGIGALDPGQQISPKEFANNIDQLFKSYGLTDLTQRNFSFVFHTCNSAYADVNTTMSKEEVLEKIRQESFIGVFYAQMRALGYHSISVTGYRGYYCGMATHNASTALVQNSFTSPTATFKSESAQYTIVDDTCTTTNTKDANLYFPVHLLDEDHPFVMEMDDNAVVPTGRAFPR